LSGAISAGVIGHAQIGHHAQYRVPAFRGVARAGARLDGVAAIARGIGYGLAGSAVSCAHAGTTSESEAQAIKVLLGLKALLFR
jgi:hypothetical protein